MKIYLAVVLLVLVVADHSAAAVSVEQIVDILESTGVLPHSSLSASVPEMDGIDSEQEHVKRCYSSAVGNQSINIFAGKAGLIIHQIVTEFKEEIFPTDDLHGKIKTIVANIRVLAKIIKECIASPEQDQVQYGVTSMSVLSPEEYSVMANGLSANPYNHHNDYSLECDDITDFSELPDSFDLREQGYVSPVKSQHQCGSCYAFSTVGAMESQHMKKHHFKSFSEQAFVNCFGCDGAPPHEVYIQAIERGIALEDDVPYLNQKGECQDYKVYKKLKNYCYRYSNRKPLSDDEMRALIYYYGATSGTLYAGGSKFAHTKGNYNGDDCKNTQNDLTHAILIVGWTEDRWIIKNSWGTKWGDNGYVYLKRGDNNCGINWQAGVPLFH